MAILTCSLSMAAEFHVAPSGSDQNPGTKAKPFKTIAAARDAVARINAKMTGDITVHLAGGTYPISESMVFEAKDSGMNGYQVIYKAVPGETPVISSGRAIQGWQLHDKENNIYKAAVGDLEFRQVHVNGKRAVRARYPNRTSEIHLGDYLTGAGVTGKPPYQLKVRAEELKGWESWSNLTEVEVVMVTHWKQKRARIASIEGNLISFQEPENQARAMHHMEQGGTPHFYENGYEFLDAEGEFYLNTQEKRLYYKPRPGEDMSSAEVVVPTVQTLVDIKGASPDRPVENLRFEGITFEYSSWTEPNQKGFTTMQSATAYSGTAAHFNFDEIVPGAIQLTNAKKVSFHSCIVEKTSAHAIIATRDVVSHCSLVGNYLRDVAAGGIYLLLSDKRSTGNTITDNTIEKIGTVYSNGCGVLVTCTPDVAILHNEIRDVRYTGISTGWSWNDKDTAARNHEVANNLIHGVMGLHDDGGGIYTLGKIPGMKMHGNYIHSIQRSPYAGNYGICGIYLDNGSCQKLVAGNVIDGVEAAFFSGNKPNYDNTFERNYYNCKLAKIIEKENTVRDNMEVKGVAWPKEALEIMERAGPRGSHRRSKYIWVEGRVGGAKVFDGKSDHIQLPHSTSLEPDQMTLQAWIKLDEYPTGKGQRQWVVGKNTNEHADGHYALMVNGNSAGVYLNIGGGADNVHGVWSPAASLQLRHWHHLAMTYDGNALRFYLDGEPAGEKAIGKARSKGNEAFAIGRRQDGFTHFKGLIDEVRIHRRALSADEIKGHFHSPQAMRDSNQEKGLIRQWSF